MVESLKINICKTHTLSAVYQYILGKFADFFAEIRLLKTSHYDNYWFIMVSVSLFAFTPLKNVSAFFLYIKVHFEVIR